MCNKNIIHDKHWDFGKVMELLNIEILAIGVNVVGIIEHDKAFLVAEKLTVVPTKCLPNFMPYGINTTPGNILIIEDLNGDGIELAIRLGGDYSVVTCWEAVRPA